MLKRSTVWVLLFLGACAHKAIPDFGDAEVNAQDQLVRERAAVFFAEEKLSAAREALAPLVERDNPYGEDLLRMAILDLAEDDVDAASKHLHLAEGIIPNSPSLQYNLGRLALREDNLEQAENHFGRAAELAPKDIPSQYQLAATKALLGDAEAVSLFDRILDLGIENTASWHLAALYQLGRFQLQNGNTEASSELLGEFSRLQATGMATLSASQIAQGNFGTLLLPAPRRFQGMTAESSFASPTMIIPGSWQGYACLDLKDDWVLPDGTSTTKPTLGETQIILWGEEGLTAVSVDSDRKPKSQQLWEQALDLVRGLDFDQDGDLDFWIFRGNQARLLEQVDGKFQVKDIPLPSLPGKVADAVVVDEDHEGDLDLLLVGDFGVRLWRDDGIAQGGSFQDVSEFAGLPEVGPLWFCQSEDFDTDEDVDFLVVGEEQSFLLSNQRGGKFQQLATSLPGVKASAQLPKVGDWDGDGRPDIAFTSDQVWLGQAGGGFKPSSGILPSAAVSQDWDRDLLPDRIQLRQEGLQVEWGIPGQCSHMTLALRGTTDNRRAVGAIVEYRAGDLYQRVYWRGEPLSLAFGNRSKADWLKITWPNGVTQFGLDIPNQELIILSQKEGLAGSCPFLYTWNGKTFEFISDVIGATPLGLPIEEGVFVPPDHDEYVLVSGKQLVEKDGFLELQLTEELREVTFFDRVRLDVLDHSQDSEVYPNERFCFPPFPEAHNHIVVQPLAPSRVWGSDGKDWTEALQTIDFRFAVPFEPYQSTKPSAQPWGGQFLGLAPQHFLEIEFPQQRVASASKLRLLMTGWFYWSVASVNMASSRTPGIGFVPPRLEVPDGKGGWVMVSQDLGFPSGKLKTMVIDVTNLLNREDPRIRISSTLRLYWDSIRLATDNDDAPLRVTQLEPSSARLWQRGFSKPVELPQSAELLLEWFQWDELEAVPRWNQHPGLYTKLGNVLPLLEQADDMFVVMGSGDAIHVQFDATQLPPLPDGWTRDYLVYLDGWAKDRDYNCADVEATEPFPFHAMSAFPYSKEESFPSDAVHIQWRLDWLTRMPRRWLDEVTERGHRK